MHNTNILDSPQFLRGAENFRMALGFMDGRQMNSEGAWLPVNECPRSVDAPSHLCVSLTIADKDSYVGTTGQLDVTFTLHHRDSKLSVVRNMRRTFCWGSSGSEVRNQAVATGMVSARFFSELRIHDPGARQKSRRLTCLSLTTAHTLMPLCLWRVHAVRLDHWSSALPLVACNPQLLPARHPPWRYVRSRPVNTWKNLSVLFFRPLHATICGRCGWCVRGCGCLRSAGFMRNDTLSFSVSLAPHRQQPVAATPVSSKRTRPPTRKSACASSSRGETFTDADGRAADEAAAASKSAAVETAQMTKESA